MSNIKNAEKATDYMEAEKIKGFIVTEGDFEVELMNYRDYVMEYGQDDFPSPRGNEARERVYENENGTFSVMRWLYGDFGYTEQVVEVFETEHEANAELFRIREMYIKRNPGLDIPWFNNIRDIADIKSWLEVLEETAEEE